MERSHARFATGSALIALCLCAAHTDARQTTQSISVGATVQPYVKLTVTQPHEIIIGNKDCNNGYLDIPDTGKKDPNPQSTQLTLKTNARAGYSLIFTVGGPAQQFITGIEVMGLGKSVTLPAGGGTISVPYTGPNPNYTLTYRLLLAKVKDGPYPWPLKDGTSFPWPVTIAAQPN
jgi:hypothetical protein